jgi:hypothetical protein
VPVVLVVDAVGLILMAREVEVEVERMQKV